MRLHLNVTNWSMEVFFIAIWQFQFMIISKQNYHVLDERDYIWRKNDINNEAIEFITEYLEPNKCW